MKFKERDTSKPAEQQGIFRKFQVSRVDGSDVVGGKHFGCRYFVLDMDHDAHAPAALRAYADSCASTHPELAADLRREFGEAERTTAPVSLTDDDLTQEFSLDAIIKGIRYADHGRHEGWQAELKEYIRIECNRAILAAAPSPAVAVEDETPAAYIAQLSKTSHKSLTWSNHGGFIGTEYIPLYTRPSPSLAVRDVPREPTAFMVASALRQREVGGDMTDIWRSMWDAAIREQQT